MKKEKIIEEFFKKSGPLSEIVSNFHEREDQVEMAKIVNEAVEQKKSLIVEAGTGVGKTFSYLVPALINGGKVVISTATKNLQDQLFFKDIPTIRDALKIPININILKGRANYICQLRMENAVLEGQFLNKEDAKYIHEIKKYQIIVSQERYLSLIISQKNLPYGHLLHQPKKIVWVRIANFIRVVF